MALASYKVKKGDTLSEIAQKYRLDYNLGSNVWAATDYLAKINNIPDKDRIYVGQVIYLEVDSKGQTPHTKVNTSKSKVVIRHFGLQSNNSRIVIATWEFTEKDTFDHYQIEWTYQIGKNPVLIDTGASSDTKYKQYVYTIPSNADCVWFRVKPVAKNNDKNKNKPYWTGSWCSKKKIATSSIAPGTPSAPSTKIENAELVVSLSNISADLNATEIEFQVVKDGYENIQKSQRCDIITNAASWSLTNLPGGWRLKARCRATSGNLEGDWSDYSEVLTTPPGTPGIIEECRALTETSVYISWASKAEPSRYWGSSNTHGSEVLDGAFEGAASYKIEYSEKREYLDSSNKTTVVDNIKEKYYTLTGLESGKEYFFRVKGVNSSGESDWSDIVSVLLGTLPSAPTTWSSTTTATVEDIITLNWAHNSEDGSPQTYAEIELYINGAKNVIMIDSVGENDDDKTMFYEIDTSKHTYQAGAKIQWRVRTSGATKELGEWSVQRTIDVYAKPTLRLELIGDNITPSNVISSFPFRIDLISVKHSQKPISYHLSIVTANSYEIVDDMGVNRLISAGTEIYSKQFDRNTDPQIIFSAGDINLENGCSYVATGIVSMDSGLTAEATIHFSAELEVLDFEPFASIVIDDKTLTASIRPYCTDEDDVLIPDLKLSVYRREFDGSLAEIASDLPNNGYRTVTDPHPALDYARYRIVAKSGITGLVNYLDMPAYPVGEKAIIIQWDEAWSEFDAAEDPTEQPPWSGSLLRLPYNVDVSDNHSPDVSLVNYIGRKRPVSYYGTHLGESATWNVVIPKSDIDTLYLLRRLAIWMGNVYVREPSGSGYWAHIVVSFSQKHTDLTIPVTFNITRVTGGA